MRVHRLISKCLNKWKELHISSTLNNTRNYTTLLHNVYLSSYTVRQLSGVTFGLKAGQMSVPHNLSSP